MSEPRGGFRIESTFDVDRSPAEVLAFVADTANFGVVPRSLVVEIHGSGYGMTEAATLGPIADRTRATFVETVWPTSLAGRLLVALSGGVIRRDLRPRSERLRAVLEQPVDPRA